MVLGWPYVGTPNGLRLGGGQPPTDRYHIKIHNCHDIGAHFGHQLYKQNVCLKLFKKVFVVILGSSYKVNFFFPIKEL